MYRPSSGHYQTSSLSHPANSPFTARTQTPPDSFGTTNGNGFAGTQTFTLRADVDPLERERREVERRRARLEDRKQRILHAKTRVMGVDVDALNEQVRDREERLRAEAERDAYHDQLTVQHSRVLCGLEEERKVRERIQKEELTQYRTQQAQEKRIRDVQRASAQSNDDRDAVFANGTSTTFLTFVGEDREKSLRDRAQREQQSDWLRQQISAQSNRESLGRAQDAEDAEIQAQIQELKLSNEQDALQASMARAKSVQEYNLGIAQQKNQAKYRAAYANHQANEQELQQTLSSPLLNEQVPTSALGAHRAIPYHFKGFTAEQRHAILREQSNQQALVQRKRYEEKLEEKDNALQNEIIRREMIRSDRAKEELERARLYALKEERLQQAKQKFLRDEYQKNVVYTNPVGEEYFAQFGTSCR